METAQREAVAYPESHSQVGTGPTPGQADSQGRCSGREGTALLPDDPPAIQELMNDLDGFALLQRYLILQ